MQTIERIRKRRRRKDRTLAQEYALFILNIIRKLNVLNTKTSDGNENRWRQKK